MTELLYQTDAYQRDFEATVQAVDIENHAILLDRTAFYPGGGGQPADQGHLHYPGFTLPVVRLVKKPEGIWHVLSLDVPLPPVNTALRGEIDWNRRYALMRTHTALHILCGVVFRDYGALVTGGDMEPLHGRMDFEFESLTRDLVSVIEEAVNREVTASRPVIVRILPREEAFQIPDLIRTKINLLPPGIQEIRTVEISGLDLQADGGTHVRNTADVGHIRVTDYKSKGKINKRIYIELDA
ncbi:MAG TPA: alanyl-tRNA editing protein [Anaerolinea thermolimosa]|uniref:Alanyl-tRNA editing protein n=1 Tax=Anaerolinea thermolimosa TaxID=229919 RepID=A0A3D1JDB0_9CHLR|nr:alanyl-tRNA editing protein [Anaerolinea thermolimosa]GAP07518.1 Ala-tRNA(Pro) hydrolase [Anaerolinea thermolimosa]HCE16237.1 alanyl-tRNA editing protein [Anaerolinea thermolimosa]